MIRPTKFLPLALLAWSPACGFPVAEPRAAGLEEASVAFSCRSSHSLVLAGAPQEVFLYLSLRASELLPGPRPAMNLALVIDRSGSMGSEDKLVHARQAAEQLVGRLHREDRLAVIAYDDGVQTVMPSAPVADPAPFLAAIRALAPGNRTNLHGGLVRGGEEVLAHRDPERQNAVLLLSDGLANVGLTDPVEIARHAEGLREAGLRVSTMGMGLAYDEDLLCGIALQGAGNYDYVDQAESVGAFLDREIDELGRVAAREVEARITLAEGVELGQVYAFPHRREGRDVVVPLRALVSGEARKLVLRLQVSGAAGTERALASAALRYVPAGSTETTTAAAPALRVGFRDAIEEVRAARDLEVLVKAEIVQNAEALDAAMRLQKEGAFQAAQELLAARYLNSRTVNATEYKSAEVERILQRIQEVMRELERTRADAAQRRDLQLATQLQALGYMGGD